MEIELKVGLTWDVSSTYQDKLTAMDVKMASAASNGPLVTFTRGKFQTIKRMAMVATFGKMALFTKDNSKTTNSTASE